MKYSLSLCLALMIISTSCTKIIDVDLNTTDTKVVIEADITDQAVGFQVKISKTVNFSEANAFPAIKGAVVTISDNTGVTQTLTETAAGFYTIKDVKGVTGKTYFLKVVAEGKTYTASSTMPKVVDFRGIEIIENVKRPTSFDRSYTYFPIFFDPADEQNNYLFDISNKGIKDKGFNRVFNDNVTNGLPNQRPIVNSANFKVNSKDTLLFNMYCIDKGAYDYYYSLNQIADGTGSSATPSNPITNIVGGALGYFSAHTVRKVSVVIP
jgi:hypothetical protein